MIAFDLWLFSFIQNYIYFKSFLARHINFFSVTLKARKLHIKPVFSHSNTLNKQRRIPLFFAVQINFGFGRFRNNIYASRLNNFCFLKRFLHRLWDVFFIKSGTRRGKRREKNQKRHNGNRNCGISPSKPLAPWKKRIFITAFKKLSISKSSKAF
ncbi:MAG: hypothetical protein ACD_63C00133G0003 [uncultured bacterium]|nr:MAG: hypothetical protein ACD_63C00133G0003 [uncultured bacterium]